MLEKSEQGSRIVWLNLQEDGEKRANLFSACGASRFGLFGDYLPPKPGKLRFRPT